MAEFVPKDMPEITLEINFLPGTPAVWTAPENSMPAEDDEIDILGLTIHGQDVSVWVMEALINELGPKWEMEIIQRYYEDGEV